MKDKLKFLLAWLLSSKFGFMMTGACGYIVFDGICTGKALVVIAGVLLMCLWYYNAMRDWRRETGVVISVGVSAVMKELGPDVEKKYAEWVRSRT
jgi:hypothetical protein